MIHGVEAGKIHSHDIDYSEEEKRLIEEQSQRLQTWKKSPINILHTMKEFQGSAQPEEHTVHNTNPTGLSVGEITTTPASQTLQDGTRKLQIVFPSMKEPAQQEDSAAKDLSTQENDKNCLKNLNKEELELLRSLMKKLDFQQVQSETAAGGGVSSDETISVHTTSSLPPSDTEGTFSTASEPTAQLPSPIQTAPEPHPSESQSAESSPTSPDVDPSLQHTAEGASHEDTTKDADAEKPGEENGQHLHNNLDDEGAAFTPGMIPTHNPMAAMATMGHFMPPTAATGFMPTMLPAPIGPYMIPPPQAVYYYQMLQHAHYSQMLQQSMAAAAAIGSPTVVSSNQEDGHFMFQQKSADAMNTALQDAHNHAVDPVEVTANTDHPDDEQL